MDQRSGETRQASLNIVIVKLSDRQAFFFYLIVIQPSSCTQELLELLKKSPSLGAYLNGNAADLGSKELSELLEETLLEKQISKSECIRRSGLDRTYAYQIFSGQKKPARDKVLALLLAMELPFEEAQRFLHRANYPVLYPKNQRDCAFIYAFLHHLSVLELNYMLDDLDEPLCT